MLVDYWPLLDCPIRTILPAMRQKLYSIRFKGMWARVNTHIQEATIFNTFLNIFRAQHPFATGNAAASFFTTIRSVTQQMRTHFIVALEVLAYATIQTTDLFENANLCRLVRQRNAEVWRSTETHTIVRATLIWVTPTNNFRQFGAWKI